MVSELLIISLQVTVLLGGFFSFKCYKLGYEQGLKAEKPKSKEVIEVKEVKKVNDEVLNKNIDVDNKEFNRLMDEWLNGRPQEV